MTAKVVMYEAFVEGKLEVPKHLARTVHDRIFDHWVREKACQDYLRCNPAAA